LPGTRRPHPDQDANLEGSRRLIAPTCDAQGQGAETRHEAESTFPKTTAPMRKHG
jgi:hypothetical protein